MYTIKKTLNPIKDINDKAWDLAEVATVDTVNWAEFGDIPSMWARILYSDYGLHIQLTTDEKPLLARYTDQNTSVCTDSCMEFFFRANENDPRYMNFEFNPFGTMYFGLRKNRDDGCNPPEDKYFFDVKTQVDSDKWVLQFTVPFDYIDKTLGGHTKKMYGNLYKCGGPKPEPYYATYYPINWETPDFHRPEFFGEFILE